MSNGWWYGSLTVVFVAVFVYTLWKVPDRRLLAVYAFLSGLTYAAEYVVLVLCNGYRYYPAVMKDEYFDNILGAIVSDAVSVPIAGVLVAAFALDWKWMAALSGMIVVIEVVFLRLGIYEHYWWKLAYTALGLLAWFTLAKRVYSQLQNQVTMPLRWMVLFCTNMLLHASAVFVLAAFFHAFFFEIGWFRDPTRDHVAFATMYILLISCLFSSLVTFRIHWLWRTALTLLPVPANWMLMQYGVLHLAKWWSLAYFAVLCLLFIGVLVIVDRLVLDRSQPDSS